MEDHPKTILIVEDNTLSRQLLVKQLSQRYKVVEATNGVEGLQIIEETLPDLVITDIVMPKMDGLELITTVKKKRISIPIIVTSADEKYSDYLKVAKMLGAHDILQKNYTLEQLLTLVNSHLII